MERRIRRIRSNAIFAAVLMIIFVMFTGSFAEVSADSGQYTFSKRQNIGGYDVTFSSKVINNAYLPNETINNTLKVKGKRKSVKVSWNPGGGSGADGYIIARKKGARWYEIKRVSWSKTSFTDKKAKSKNKLYSYILIPYRKVSGNVMVGGASQNAGALTTKSKKKNVTSVTINSPATSSNVATGSQIMFSLKFPKKAYSKAIRWSSSNPSIASVDDFGVITGRSRGVAVITGKLHTGYTFSSNVWVVEPGTSEGIVDVMRSWMDYSRFNGKHKGIIDIYNSVQPLPGGYVMKYTDAWCAAAVTAASIRSGNVANTGRNCSCMEFIKIFQDAGIWEEDETIVPQPGDIILYNWLAGIKSNNASHIGVVESVNNGNITVIEGNMGVGIVGRRTVSAGWKYIRGYGRPYYSDRERIIPSGDQPDQPSESDDPLGPGGREDPSGPVE